MIYNKCPWCGKEVKRSDIKRAHKSKTPSVLRFARCQHCNNYYGQSYFTKRSIYLLVISFVWFIIICLTNLLPLVLCYILCFYFVSKGPFIKMTEDENIIIEKKQIFKGKVILKKGKLKKYCYYYLVPKFNSYDAFCTVAPIEIQAYNKRKNEIVFSFLYEHTLNCDYIIDSVLLYNYEGDFIFGELKTTHKQSKLN